jgi:cysteinyl-tRNA synthetase
LRVRDLSEIRKELQERSRWSLADENRDSMLFGKILLELCDHIHELEEIAKRLQPI